MKRIAIVLILGVAVLAYAYTEPIRETIEFTVDTRNDTLSDADTITYSGSFEMPLKGSDAILLRAVLDGPFPAESGLSDVDSGLIRFSTLYPVGAITIDSLRSGALPCTLELVLNNLNDTLFKRALKVDYAVWDTSLDSQVVSGTDTSGLTVGYKLTIDGDLIFDGR